MFLFPRREEELQSETTELKHREASWALTQPAAAAEAVMAIPFLHSCSPSLSFLHSSSLYMHLSVPVTERVQVCVTNVSALISIQVWEQVHVFINHNEPLL